MRRMYFRFCWDPRRAHGHVAQAQAGLEFYATLTAFWTTVIVVDRYMDYVV
jgi:hypothetical protein